MAKTKRTAQPKKLSGIHLSVLTLTIMNVAAVVSLRGLPAEAKYGLGSIFYYLFAALVFLIPVSLISAEMAAAWPQKGGVYRWIGEAFGARWGFLAIWLQWIQNTIWYPTVLTFSAVSIAYIGLDPAADASLAGNRIYVAAVCLVIYWGATLINLRGLSASAKISKYGGMIGTIIPAALLILFGIVWLLTGQKIQLDTNPATLLPDLSKLSNLVLASGIFLFFAGMEVSAVHVKEIDNPQKNYPKAIFLASLISVAIFIFGTLAIGFVLPEKSINLTQGLLVTFDTYLKTFHLGFLTPVLAVMLVVGVLAGVSTWIGGPSKGLLAVGHHGFLPPFLQKVNKNGIQINILIVQGCIVTVLVFLFTFMPSVQAVYQVLSQLTAILYLIMYLMLFAAGIALRVREPDRPRPYRVPGGKAGMFLIGGVGILGALLAITLSFLPPDQIKIGSAASWYGILIVGAVVFLSIPLIIYALRKPGWKNETAKNAMEPFTWENTGKQQAVKKQGR